MMKLPEAIEVVEVGPRDGLQNEKTRVPTAAKIALVDGLAAAGLRRIEVSSFVRPDTIPQLDDADAVFAGITRRPGVRYSALVPNEIGLDRALLAGVDEISVFTGVTDSFVRANIRMSVEDSLRRFAPLVARALDAGLLVRGYVSVAFGCPYDGEVAIGRALDVTASLIDMGCTEVSIGDTIGVATPGQVARWLDEARRRLDTTRLAMHFHDTRGTALANVLVALDAGIVVFDSAAGGLGGCPYAPGASGNLATEDLVWAMSGSGVATGIDIDALCVASRGVAEHLGRELPGRYLDSCRKY